MGGATKRSLISAYFLLSANFLTTQIYKCMHLTTQVYGINIGNSTCTCRSGEMIPGPPFLNKILRFSVYVHSIL